MTDPQPHRTPHADPPFDRVRRAILSPSADLASAILARDTAELTRRLMALRSRGGPYGQVAASPHFSRLLLALMVGEERPLKVH